MSPLRKRMLEEMQLRNLSEATIDSYVKAVWRFGSSLQEVSRSVGSRASLRVPALLTQREERCLEHVASEPRRAEIPLLPGLETEVVRRRDCCAQTAVGLADCPER